ncbi:MAG: SirB2 family protein [Halioglobus sp.]
MTLFSILKNIHVTCALLSICGFALRGYWAIASDDRRDARLVRVLPHLIDTLLLASAVAMLFIWGVSPLELPWVMAKIVALLVYIGLGMAVMRFAKSREWRVTAYIAALAVAAYIVSVALSHSPWGLFLVLFG